MGINIKKFKILMLILIYKVALDLAYIFFINKIYYYEGYNFDFVPVKIIESFIMTFLVTASLPNDERRPSTIAINTLNIIMIIPLLSLYAYKNESRMYFYSIIFSFLIIVFFVRFAPKIKFRLKTSINSFINCGLIIMGILVYGDLLLFNGFPSLDLLNFSNVYLVRGTVDYGFEIMKYLVPWQASIINVFFMVNFYMNKEKKKFFFMVALQILIYLITSHKTYFFYPVIVPALIYFINKGKFIYGSIVGMISVIVLSVMSYYFQLTNILGAMFVNRTLFLPAQISFQYHEYFSENGFVMLSHSFLSVFFDKPIYDVHPIRIIGSVYYNDNWPNTGFLGDAYMNFGYIGMILFSLFFALLLVVIDSISNTDKKRLLSSAMVVLFMLTLTNGALFTSLLNGGILIYIIITLSYKDTNIKRM